ncbi:MAG: hypothetical protein ACR2PG_08080 [Hyphomicrobiaceae bacterium]
MNGDDSVGKLVALVVVLLVCGVAFYFIGVLDAISDYVTGVLSWLSDLWEAWRLP